MASANSYSDTNVEESTTYFYVVTALTSDDLESPYSNEASATFGGNPLTIHVASVAVDLRSQGKNWRGTAEVTVQDLGGNPVSGATVTGDWSFEPQVGPSQPVGSSSAVSDGNGIAGSQSGKVQANSGDVFRFTVTGVVLSNATWTGGLATTGTAAVP